MPLSCMSSCAFATEVAGVTASGGVVIQSLIFMTGSPSWCRACRASQQAMSARVRDGLQAVVSADLAENVLHVVADRRRAHVQALGGGARVEARRDQAPELKLAAGQLPAGRRLRRPQRP